MAIKERKQILDKLKLAITDIGAKVLRQNNSSLDSNLFPITSGKIFTDVIFDSVISAYKSGFITFLPEYYATDEVANRVKEIERASETTI